ncbi:50S ribosomal protein L29 [Buchnera aphidicola]|uniref:50S ribosomal protein L29 n=1 Tax=Buchnera aphidicola TaxID=9 RepID=UPI0030EF3E43
MKKIFRKKSIKELNSELCLLLKEKFNLKMQCSAKKLQQTHLLKKSRKNIAIIKTLITEKTRI